MGKSKIILGILALASAAAQATERSGYIPAAGAGIVWPAPSQAIVVNPAGLHDGPRFSLTGQWRHEINKIYAAATWNISSVSIAGDYRQEGTDAYTEGAMGISFGDLRVGFTARMLNGSTDGINGDAGAVLRIANWRLATVIRHVAGGIQRIDAGVGFRLQTAMFEVDVKKASPFDDSSYLIDAGMTMVSDAASFAVGYDTTYNGGFSGGGLHAGASYGFAKRFFIDLFYRPLAQEWTTDKYAFGIRVFF